MPNGKTHDIITFVCTPIVVGATWYFTRNVKTTAIMLSLFLFSSFMFNGDLDTPSAPYNRWWIFKMIWIPYQLMFHHRSVFTHGLIIGTVIRVLYLTAIPMIILSFKGNAHFIWNIDKHFLILLLIGLESGAAVHTIADYTIKS